MDVYDLWVKHDREDQKWLDKRPTCDVCHEPIQGDHLWVIHDTIMCEDCLDDCRRYTDDFI